LHRQYRNVSYVDIFQLLMRTQPHYFRLGWIESQSAGTHPVVNITDARGETLHCHCSVADCALKVAKRA